MTGEESGGRPQNLTKPPSFAPRICTSFTEPKYGHSRCLARAVCKPVGGPVGIVINSTSCHPWPPKRQPRKTSLESYHMASLLMCRRLLLHWGSPWRLEEALKERLFEFKVFSSHIPIDIFLIRKTLELPALFETRHSGLLRVLRYARLLASDHWASLASVLNRFSDMSHELMWVQHEIKPRDPRGEMALKVDGTCSFGSMINVDCTDCTHTVAE